MALRFIAYIFRPKSSQLRDSSTSKFSDSKVTKCVIKHLSRSYISMQPWTCRRLRRHSKRGSDEAETLIRNTPFTHPGGPGNRSPPKSPPLRGPTRSGSSSSSLGSGRPGKPPGGRHGSLKAGSTNALSVGTRPLQREHKITVYHERTKGQDSKIICRMPSHVCTLAGSHTKAHATTI